MIDDHIPPAKVALILRLHDEGAHVTTIAKRTHVAVSDIVQILRERCFEHDHGRGASSKTEVRP